MERDTHNDAETLDYPSNKSSHGTKNEGLGDFQT